MGTLLQQRDALVEAQLGLAYQLVEAVDTAPADPVAAVEFLLGLVPGIVATAATAAAWLAVEWYTKVRDAAKPKTVYTPQVVLPTGLHARSEALVRWGVDPLFHPDTHTAPVEDLLFGGAQRAMVDGHRETVMVASVQDPAVKGWARFGSAGSCDFCDMLISRGNVYQVGSTFASHDHCNCVAGPVFTGAQRVSRFVPTDRRISPSTRKRDNQSVRDWIAANK